jgi:hypothetical protein
MSNSSKKLLVSPRTWSKYKAIWTKHNLFKITPSREWRSLMREQPWFATCATGKALRPMSARWRIGEKGRKTKIKSKQASSPTPTPIRWTRRPPHLIFEEEEEWQGGGHQGEQASQHKWGQTHLGAKVIISNMKSTKKVWIPKGK